MTKIATIEQLQQEIKSYKSVLAEKNNQIKKLQKDNERILIGSFKKQDDLKAAQTKNKELKQQKDKLQSKLTASKRWIDAEKKRPEDGHKIIIESAIGLYWGIFSTKGDGKILIQNRKFDISYWYDIYRWIPYPEDEK